MVECIGYTNTNLFTGQALGPDLDRLRLIGAPAAGVYSIIISAPAIKFFIIIMGAALPLVCRESFDTLQDPLRFSSAGAAAGVLCLSSIEPYIAPRAPPRSSSQAATTRTALNSRAVLIPPDPRRFLR